MQLKADWLTSVQVQTLVRVFQDVDEEIRFVGGCVRDSVLGRKVRDIDAATPILPEHTLSLLENANIQAIPTGLAHGTVTAVIDHLPIEITTLRKDMACDGRHAEVVYTDVWQDDAARRDFTMNALYATPEGEVIDFFNGIDDARAGKVQFIGNPDQRIKEDYLRILRLFRFFAHYGKEPLDDSALTSCSLHAKQLHRLSGERIGQEMRKLLAATEPFHALLAMQGTHVLSQLIPHPITIQTVSSLAEIEKNILHSPNWMVRLAGLLRRVPVPVLTEVRDYWRLSNEETDILRILLQEPFVDISWDKPTLHYWQRRLGTHIIYDKVLIAWAEDARTDVSATYKAMLEEISSWEIPVFPVTGADLIARGYTPGKALGAALKSLEKKWEENGYVMDKEALLASLI